MKSNKVTITLKKYIFVVFTLFMFTGCFSFSSIFSVFSFSNEDMSQEKIVFELNDEELVVNLSNIEAVDTFNTCTNFSYTLNANNDLYGKLFVEYINLNQDCKWNGLSTSFFTTLFKDTLKLKSMSKVQSVDVKNYYFATYKVNDEFYMNIILKYTSFTSKIIIDYNGKLSQALLKELKPDYELKYVDRVRFESDYNDSLVLRNVFRGYFTRESEIFEK